MTSLYHNINNPQIKRRSEYKDRLEDYVIYTSASYGQPFAYSLMKDIAPAPAPPAPAPAPPCFSFLTNIYSCFLYK